MRRKIFSGQITKVYAARDATKVISEDLNDVPNFAVIDAP